VGIAVAKQAPQFLLTTLRSEMVDIYQRFKEVNINLSEKTGAIPTDLLDMIGICNHYLNFIKFLYSNEANINKRLLIKEFHGTYSELYYHFDYHIKSLKKPLTIIIKDLKKQFGKDIMAKAIKISDIPAMADIASNEHNVGKAIKIRAFQPGENLVGSEPVVMFFQGRDWQENLFIAIDSDPSKVTPMPHRTLHLERPVIDLLVEKARQYRQAFLSFWNTPEMGISELADLINDIYAKS
jgi:hypothetical protein